MIKHFFLLLIGMFLLLSVSLAQDEQSETTAQDQSSKNEASQQEQEGSEIDPFRDFDPPKKEEGKVEKKIIKNVEYKKIKNPRTYLSAKNYTLRGIVMSSENAFAIVGSEDIIDQVFEIGEVLGKEGWQVLSISESKIEVGRPGKASKNIILHLAN